MEHFRKKLELEFVTLQFMMGGNVHLLGELQSQAVVENFRQEVFAKFPIPAFHVTSSVICCDQATSKRPERSQLLSENGCSRQQERIYSQLIFFLCRAPFLKSWDQLDRLAEMLHKLKSCIYYNPVALVGVIVQVDPDPGLDAEQEARARRWLRCLLDGFFCCDLLLDHDGTEPEVQVQVAVYQSGQPERALEVKRAACQAIRAALNGPWAFRPHITVVCWWTSSQPLAPSNVGHARRGLGLFCLNQDNGKCRNGLRGSKLTACSRSNAYAEINPESS
uniref:Uncharacterized protein n=1 Tax=Salvator merianae TaxID=96440 RepID=A0A8D0EGE3_SALMN